jgi:hypothetical protein
MVIIFSYDIKAAFNVELFEHTIPVTVVYLFGKYVYFIIALASRRFFVSVQTPLTILGTLI